MMTADDLAALRGCLALPDDVITNASVVQRLSKDFYWYSPILKALLESKVAEAVVRPGSTAEVVAVLAVCHERRIPVTARGAGTGNYGQAVPLCGGVVLDLSRLDKIEEITGEGVAIVGPGTRLGVLETAARDVGWELRCYPSTVAKATVGGFLGGGSGGIGSVTHGGLRDFGTVRAIEVVTMEAAPRVVLHEGDDVHDVLHSWGTNGIITRIWLTLTPALDWSQCVVAFDSFAEAFDFAETIATQAAWNKRLVTVFEAPIASSFSPLGSFILQDKAHVFLMIATVQVDRLTAAMADAKGEVTFLAAYNGVRSTPLLSDYTWNHTTLWYMKQQPDYTYLQCLFSATEARSQFEKLKQEYGDDFLLHLEFMKLGTGVIAPGSIPLIRYSTEERLNEMIAFCRSIGVSVANPHSNHVEGGGRYRPDNVQLQTKYKYDSLGLLNPGKMATFEPVENTASVNSPIR